MGFVGELDLLGGRRGALQREDWDDDGVKTGLV
jgi:hypothetical protein